jgi:hypothetical protein
MQPLSVGENEHIPRAERGSPRLVCERAAVLKNIFGVSALTEGRHQSA